MTLKLKRTPGLYLVGFMGSGKTTVGKLLAVELGWHFVDIDAEIERVQGVSVSEIFEQKGEAAFRALESDAIKRHVSIVERGQATVVALGGGAFTQASNFELLENNGVSIWLDCPVETAAQRTASESHRPLARDPERFRTLFEERRFWYAKADYQIDAAADPVTVVKRILALPLF